MSIILKRPNGNQNALFWASVCRVTTNHIRCKLVKLGEKSHHASGLVGGGIWHLVVCSTIRMLAYLFPRLQSWRLFLDLFDKGATEELSRKGDEDLNFPEKWTSFETCFFRLFIFIE